MIIFTQPAQSDHPSDHVVVDMSKDENQFLNPFQKHFFFIWFVIIIWLQQ